MPTFTYRGLDQAGQTVRGEIVADDAHGATVALRARAIFPMEVAAGKSAAEPAAARGSLFGRNTDADVAILTRQLANLVAGGVPLMSAFAALTEHTENPTLRAVLAQMQQGVHGGQTLWESFAAHPSVFPSLYVNMVKAGEASGQLSAVLNWLADYQEQEQSRRMQIKGALTYPALLVIAGVLAIIMLITLVVPKFAVMFEEFGQALPLPTKILLDTANFAGKWGWLIAVGVVLVVVAFRRYITTPSGRRWFDALRLRIPLFGQLTLKSAMSRFARTTATLMQGGVPLLEALVVVRDVMDNSVLAEATDRAREGMTAGERFADRLAMTGVFPRFLTRMIGIGEETGDLRNMLNTVAGTYDIEVETALKSLVSMLEPMIIISLGGVMGGIMLAMLLPIFTISVLGG